MSGHLAHGPANRGRRVLETAAPLFVCEPWGAPGGIPPGRHGPWGAPDKIAGSAIGREPRRAPRGGVVVVHDLFGLTPDVEAATRRLAADGWLAVAPFLYHGHGGPVFCDDTVFYDDTVFRDLPRARAELSSLPLARLGGDVAAAVSYLAGRGCPATVVLGFGTGGYLAAWSVSSAAAEALAGARSAGGQVVAAVAVSAADPGPADPESAGAGSADAGPTGAGPAGAGSGFPPLASLTSASGERTAPLLELAGSPAEEAPAQEAPAQEAPAQEALWRRIGAFLSEIV